MQDTCPVNTVDEHVARIVAGLVVCLALLSLAPSFMWVSGLLAIDFFIRAWISRRYSPLRWVAKRVAAALRLSPKHVYAPPKQFAARIGSVITIAMVALHLVTHEFAGVVTLVLIVAASLEAFAGFCIACWLYPYAYRLRRA